MTRKILLFFLLQVSFSTFVMAQGKNLSELSLNGKVRYIKSSYFDTQNNYQKLDSIVKGNRKHSLYMIPEIENIYDKAGNLIEENKLDFISGEISSKYVYLYNNDENLIEKKEVFPNDSISNKEIYQYDKTGKLSEKVSLDEYGNILSKVIYNYNKKGQKTEVLTYIKDDLSSKTIYSYNINGYTEEITNFSIKKIRKYEKELLVSQLTYDKNNKLLEKRSYKYNDSGKLLEENAYSPSGTLIHTYNYEYDSRNNEILFEHYKGDQLITRWKYQYTKIDEYGNWLQRINLLDLDDGYWYIEEREIEYYE